MTQSAHDIPHVWTMMEVDVTGLVAIVKTQKETFRQREGVNLTYLPFVLQAVARALRSSPEVNSSWQNDSIVLHQDINLGIAVARDKGLIVPVLRNADTLSIPDLAQRGQRPRTKRPGMTNSALRTSRAEPSPSTTPGPWAPS